MEYLQYSGTTIKTCYEARSFKPYYKWNTFNTDVLAYVNNTVSKVLNLIINGIPSIHTRYEIH